MLRRWLSTFMIFFTTITVSMIGGVVWLQRDLPSPSRLESLEPTLGTTVYSRDGTILYEFFKERRVLVPLDDIPRHLIDAVIATEDREFREHWGINVFAVGRAALENLMAGHVVQGASTITQQLARDLFLTREVNLTRKLREALLALRIEQTYTKNRILEMYLNQIYFGEGAYGVEAASLNLFGKHVREIDLHEAALLAGLPKNPAGYSPRTYPERALARRATVLAMMSDFGAVSPEQARVAGALPLGTIQHIEEARLGSYFVEHVRRDVISRYGAEALYSGGLAIHTTLDPGLQKAAEDVLEERLRTMELEQDYEHKRDDELDLSEFEAIPYVQGALLALDAHSGGVVAMVGGRDFRDSPFNRATQALRQPGSGFKPFVYTAAIASGYTPADSILDAPIVVPGAGPPVVVDEEADPPVEEPTDWVPTNYTEDYQGDVRLRYALKRSINIPAVKLGIMLGPHTVARYAHQMGISTPLSSVYSIPLGSSEVRLIDMVAAYGVLANQGIGLEPYAIERIEDRRGRVLEQHTGDSREILPSQVAYVVTNMLESVVDSGTGWAARAWGFQHPAAGKTGTTNDCTDAWFTGFTPRIICGAWVGFDDRSSLGEKMTGARVALPIWTEFMKSAHVGLRKEPFPRPPGVIVKKICADSGRLATDGCPRILEEVFVEGTEPKEPCCVHAGRLPRQHAPEARDRAGI